MFGLHGISQREAVLPSMDDNPGAVRLFLHFSALRAGTDAESAI
jgi:hypothetical protein